MARKYSAIDVVKLYSTLTLEHWEGCLRTAYNKGNIEKLIAWRYGMQAGLADAAAKGLNTPEIDVWVMKRIYNLEKCARSILKRKYKNIVPDHKATKDAQKYIAMARLAKKQRDRELEDFFMRSNY